MLDLLTATHLLYGDCTLHPDTNDIIISSGKLTEEQLAEVEAKATELYNDSLLKQYGINRQKEYPSIEEQIDMQFHDSINGTTTWIDTIKAIKEKYPKPDTLKM